MQRQEETETLITEFTAYFENRKQNLAFDVHDGTGYIYLVADGLQMAEVAKLLLLKGKRQCFKVKIFEGGGQDVDKKGPKTKNKISRKSADS